MEGWLASKLPSALEWGHDDNMSDGLSINLFHIHVYIRCPLCGDLGQLGQDEPASG